MHRRLRGARQPRPCRRCIRSESGPAELGFNRAVAAATCRPRFQPGDMLSLYIWGYLNQVRSSRHFERACVRDLVALWLMRRLAPDHRTIAAFRHDNPEAIIAASAAFVRFCREQGLVGGRVVAVDGTKMRAVASPRLRGSAATPREFQRRYRVAQAAKGSAGSTAARVGTPGREGTRLRGAGSGRWAMAVRPRCLRRGYRFA